MTENLIKEITDIENKLDQLYQQRYTYAPGLLSELGGICLFIFYYGRIFNDEKVQKKGVYWSITFWIV